MKAFKPAVLIMIFTVSLFSCNAQTSGNKKAGNLISDDVRVYYFHNTKRCATCNAVEDETKIALEMFYREQMTDGTMEFTSLNLQEDEGKKLAEILKVSGQALLIVKGEESVNLTNEGFMNARTNPAKFHEILKEQIDKLL